MSNPPKVGFLAGAKIAPNMENVLRNFGQIFADDLELWLLTTAPEIPQQIEADYCIFRDSKPLLVNPGEIFSNWKLCREFLSEVHPDLLLNISHPHAEGVVVSTATMFSQVTSLVRVTGNSYGEHQVRRDWSSTVSAWFKHYLLAHVGYRLADFLLPVGDKLAGELKKRGINPEKIFVQPQPFDSRPFETKTKISTGSQRKKLGLPTDRKIILFVGRLNYLKGVDDLDEIVSTVCAKSTDYCFCLIGPGGGAGLFDQFSDNEVVCPGRIPPEKVHEYYKVADLFILPSKIEGLPNVLLEAFAAELPVIASPVGEIPDYVRQTASSPEEFVDYILAEDWEKTPLPERLSWGRVKEDYKRIFAKLIPDVNFPGAES